MKVNFRTLLRKFCLESTILGLKYFYLYPDRLSRCFWTVNMVAVSCLACVMTQRLYSRFAEMPTQITIENQYEPVANLPYPAITLCSPVQITKSYAKKLSQRFGNLATEIDLEQTLRYFLGFYEILPNVNETAVASLQSLMKLKNITTSELLGGAAQSCSSFLKLCFFDMKRYQNCDTLFLPVLTAQGLCCSFNNKYFYNGKMNEHSPNAITRTVRTTGEGRGLTVVADYDVMDAVEETVLNGGAIEVMFSDSIEFPTDSESALIETNTESFHVINAEYTTSSVEVRTLYPENRKCYLDDEVSLKYFDKYSKSDCDLMCIVQAVTDECGCQMFYLTQRTPHACNITNLPCIMYAMYTRKSMYTCDCLADCEPRKYSADIITGNFNALPYMLNNPFTDLKINKSTAIMNFFFVNSMYVKKKQETVMSIPILISNLGGIFGLCLGCSYISVLEILFYLYMSIRNHIRSRKHRTFVRYIEYNN